MNIRDRIHRYERAEITIVALHEKKTKKNYNIYSLVELCPFGQMKTPVLGDSEHHSILEKLNKDYSLLIRRAYCNDPFQGLSFFHDKKLRIIYDDTVKDNDILYDFSEIIPEPDGEEGILFNSDSPDNSPLKPVIPEYPGSVRIYTQISSNDDLQKLLKQEEIFHIGLIIRNVLGISLSAHLEYWGSVFLCLPDPFIRRVSLRLGRDRKLLLVHIKTHNKQSVKGYTFEITDERLFGKGFCYRKKVEEDRFFIEMPNEPEKLRYRIYTAEEELIEDTASYFMKQLHFTLAIAGQSRIFKLGNTEKRIHMQTYNDFTVGDTDESTYRQRLEEEAKKRNLKLLEENRTFVYFPGNKENAGSKAKAETIIREIIGKAKKTCIICDPYLSAADFLAFGIAVSSLDLVLHLITSEMFLIQPLHKGGTKTQGDKLVSVLNQVKGKMKVQCHVLEGRKVSPLHDRFIIVDDSAYLLGSSLSEFGSRATTLFKVPDSAALEGQARQWISNQKPSTSLEDWLMKQRG